MKNNGHRAKPRGKPFTGKDDLRNGKNGGLTEGAAKYGAVYRNCVARLMPPEQLAETVVKAVKMGRVWAINMLHDDCVGLPPQIGDYKVDHALTVKVVQLKDQDGNGNTDK